jgi:hypothetical protein
MELDKLRLQESRLVDMPRVHPQFDSSRVLKEDQLGALGFGLVGAFAKTVDRKFRIEIADHNAGERTESVYAFVVAGEVIRIGHTRTKTRPKRLADRLREWQRDVTRGFRLTPQTRAKRVDRRWLTWLKVIGCLDAITLRDGQVAVYAKAGSETEERLLLRLLHPRANPGDR